MGFLLTRLYFIILIDHEWMKSVRSVGKYVSKFKYHCIEDVAIHYFSIRRRSSVGSVSASQAGVPRAILASSTFFSGK